jgi:hypothetical protein
MDPGDGHGQLQRLCRAGRFAAPRRNFGERRPLTHRGWHTTPRRPDLLRDAEHSAGRQHAVVRIAALVVAAIVCCGMSPSAASARKTVPAAPISIHPHFTVAATGGVDLLPDANYLFVPSQTAADLTQAGVLINDLSGERTQFSHAGCNSPVLGGPWLVFQNCGGPQVTLYSITGGASMNVLPPSGADPVALGSDWVEFDRNCDLVHVCPNYTFVNVQSGAEQPPPKTTPTRIVDLNSPTLVSAVCRPLRVPGNGQLILDGRFALADSRRGVFLEHCGSRLHERLAGNVYCSASTRAIVCPTSSPRLTFRGVWLPSRRSFVLAIPTWLARLERSFGFERFFAGPRHLYVLYADGRLWSTALPSGPPAP